MGWGITRAAKGSAAKGARASGTEADAVAERVASTVANTAYTVTPAPITRQLHGYYDAFGLPASALKPVTLDAAGHTMPTTAYGGACGTTDEPYIGKCGFEAAHAILDAVLGGEHQHRHGHFARAQALEHLDAGQARQAQVEDQ